MVTRKVVELHGRFYLQTGLLSLYPPVTECFVKFQERILECSLLFIECGHSLIPETPRYKLHIKVYVKLARMLCVCF